ncbi:DNA polymerase III subunit delta' [Tundrisphaera lichenicola]|uniref:DNA polymerase III subunit delta' n=1 Tax=Tundrisphaera lichenicola TaxID=2029860 RepID=UPI003EB988C9
MPWHSIRGHDRVIATLRRALAQGRLPHAFLFAGPEGIGKLAFSLRLAQALLCERVSEALLDPCGECPGCLQVIAGTHPDLLRVGRPEDKHELPIRVIRDLCLDLGLKPMSGRRKVAIVDDADDMNDEAANAFLKTLEEPPPGSVLILIATSAEGQLDTILSRCRVVRFDPLPPTELAEVLIEQGVVDSPEAADRLSKLAEGSVARARGLADPALTEFRRALFDEIAGPRGFDAPALARRIEAFVNLAGKESGAKRVRARLVFGELLRLFRGSLWKSTGLAPPSPDPDDRRAITALADRLGAESLLSMADRCLEADYHVRRNLYMPLVLEDLTHDLGAFGNPKPRA